MWGNNDAHNTSNSANEGGFLDKTGDSSVLQQGDQGDKKRGSNLIPVMIGHLKRPLDTLSLWGESVHMVTFLAIVRSCNSDSIKTTYTLEDETGIHHKPHLLVFQ